MKRRKILTFAILAGIFAASAVPAAETSEPAAITSEEAKKVIDYYFYGQGGGAVFMDAALCRNVETDGPNKNNCKNDIDLHHFPLDETITAWASCLVPKDDSGTIYVEFSNMGMSWKITPLEFKSSIRYRNWATYKLDKPGEWTISFKQVDEVNQKSTILKEFKVLVK